MTTPELIIAARGMSQNIREIVDAMNPKEDSIKSMELRLHLIRLNLDVMDRYLKECLTGEEDEEEEDAPGL